MLPLYKWSGGKRNEIKLFKEFYPKNYELYIEPFFGAGAVYFELLPEKAIINDIHPESINFLNQIKNGKAKEIYDLMSEFPNDEKINREQFLDIIKPVSHYFSQGATCCC